MYPDPRGYPQLKPQVIAPGVAIESAMIESGQHYGAMTGTSMSTPHVAGLVALMLEAGSCLVGDYAALGGLIMQTARPVPYASGGTPSPGPGNVPNYATGWGEIDAAAAVDAAADACGPTGFVAGSVRGADGAPVAGARVEFLPAGTAGDAHTDASGEYVRRVPANGAAHTLRVSAHGYLPYVETGVQVAPGARLYHRGAPFEALYAVQGGFLKTRTPLENGSEHVNAFHMAGELLGFDGVGLGRHTCDAVALEDSTVCVMPYRQLERLAQHVPQLQQHLYQMLGREIVHNHGVMLLMASMCSEQRLAAFLLNLSQRLTARALRARAAERSLHGRSVRHRPHRGGVHAGRRGGERGSAG